MLGDRLETSPVGPVFHDEEIGMSIWIRVVFVLLISGILNSNLAAGASSTGWKGRQDRSAGVLTMHNPHEPMGPAQVGQPEIIWHVGDDEDGSDRMFGWITDIQIDDAGNFYLLDNSLNVIHVLGPDGRYLRQIGGPGEGPGEFRNATDFMLMPGGLIGVTQILPAKVITLDTEGVPGPYFETCGGVQGLNMVDKAESAGDFIVVGSGCGSPAARGIRYALEYVDRQGHALATLREHTERAPDGNINITTNHPFEFTRYWSLSARGRVFVAPQQDEYLIEVYGPDGGLDRVIEREYKTLRRSEKDLAADRKRQEEMRRRFGGMVQLVGRKYERDIDALYARPDGGVWVLSSESVRDRQAGAVGPFEVFDAAGRFERRLTLAVDYDPKKDDFLVEGNYLFVLKQAQVRPASSSSSSSGGLTSMVVMAGGGSDDDEEDDPTPPSVVCYRLK